MAITSFRGEHAFLSNFTWCKVHLDGFEYTSTEHAFQAAKTVDEEERKVIRLCKTAAESKKLGKKVKMRDGWEEMKIRVMEDLLRQKFNQAKFAELLLNTGDEDLIEGNYWQDKFWGQCPIGVGFNHLGRLLMKIREELQQNGYTS
jgi:N-glycosidase YbiA